MAYSLKSLLAPRRALVGIFFVSLAILGVVLAMEHWGGFAPCLLCYQQRYMYYLACGLCVAGLVAPRWNVWVLLALGVGFVANGVFGGWHAGIEYGWWEGPASCSVAWDLPASTEAMRQSLATHAPADCSQAAWRLFGISLAGYNLVVSLILAGAAFAAFALRREKV